MDQDAPVIEADEPCPSAVSSAIATRLEKLIQLRLAPDAMRLEIFLGAGVSHLPLQSRIEYVLSCCTALDITPLPAPGEVRRFLGRATEKHWLTLIEGHPATPPINGSIDLLYPAVNAAPHDRFRTRSPVRRGQAIARIQPPQDGAPGYDVQGRVRPALAARPMRVPAGENTHVAETAEGSALIADCDGEVVFDHLTFHVRPMHLFTRRELVHHEPVVAEGDVFMVDGVPSLAHIVTTGEILVDGDAEESTLISTGGPITILGCVTGHHQRHAQITAASDVTARSVLHVDIETPRSIYIQTQARNARLKAGEHLYLSTRLRHALYAVDLQIHGAVIPPDDPHHASDVATSERTTFDVACDIPAEIGLTQSPGVITFQRCLIVQMSVASARVKLLGRSGETALAANRVVYLKLTVPGAAPVQLLARTATGEKDAEITVLFRQISHQDEAEITAYCLSLLRLRTTQDAEAARQGQVS